MIKIKRIQKLIKKAQKQQKFAFTMQIKALNESYAEVIQKLKLEEQVLTHEIEVRL